MQQPQAGQSSPSTEQVLIATSYSDMLRWRSEQSSVLSNVVPSADTEGADVELQHSLLD